jgi:hypothetical protein
MVQAAQDPGGFHWPSLTHVLLARIGGHLLQPLVWPVAIEIGCVLEQDAPVLAEKDIRPSKGSGIGITAPAVAGRNIIL